MKIAFISQGSKSSQMTAIALRQHFDIVDELDLGKITIDIADHPSVMYDGSPFGTYDCVYAKGSFRMALILRALSEVIASQQPGCYMPYSPTSYTIGHDKITSHLHLLHNDIPTPLTYIASSTDSARKLMKTMHFPIVIKLPSGTQGKGVMFVDSFAAASSVLDTLAVLRQPFLLQEFVDTEGTDIRLFVVGEKVVAAMKRSAKTDEKRANIHAGATGEIVVPTAEMKRIALKAARSIGADICAIDMLLCPVHGPLVIEVNVSPGLQGITEVTKINVAEIIAKYLATRTDEVSKKHSTKETTKTINAGSAHGVNCIHTKLAMRGAKLILPEIAHNISGISDVHDLELCVEKGRIEIKRMKM